MFTFRHLVCILNKSTPAVVTIPVVGLNYWSQQRRKDSSEHYLWPNIQLNSAMGLRSAYLTHTMPSDFSKDKMKAHVILKVHFIPHKEDYDGPNHMLGSGFIVHEQGVIVTTTATVRNYGYVKARLWDDNEFREVKGKVVDRAYDKGFALIQLMDENNPQKVWPTVELTTKYGNNWPVGDEVYAVANPRFNYEMSVTKGRFTGQPVVGAKISDLCISREPYIPHSATVGSGDAGGALLDTEGKVIGMNFAQYDKYRNFCLFHREIGEYIKKKEDDFAEFKIDSAPQVGAMVYWLDKGSREGGLNDKAEREGVQLPDTNGILVWGTDVDGGSILKANNTSDRLQRLDVITHVNGVEVKEMMDLYKAIDKQSEVKIKFVRSGNTEDATLKKKSIKWSYV